MLLKRHIYRSKNGISKQTVQGQYLLCKGELHPVPEKVRRRSYECATHEELWRLQINFDRRGILVRSHPPRLEIQASDLESSC
jgi:hypothetical protein